MGDRSVALTAREAQIQVEGRHGPEVVAFVIERASDSARDYALLIAPIRAVAKQLGYAIGVHGTLARDIDLMAVPWTDNAVKPKILANAVLSIAKAFNRNGFAGFAASNPTKKPHGRLAWSIVLAGASYIDLSIMPPERRKKP